MVPDFSRSGGWHCAAQWDRGAGTGVICFSADLIPNSCTAWRSVRGRVKALKQRARAAGATQDELDDADGTSRKRSHAS